MEAAQPESEEQAEAASTPCAWLGALLVGLRTAVEFTVGFVLWLFAQRMDFAAGRGVPGEQQPGHGS